MFEVRGQATLSKDKKLGRAGTKLTQLRIVISFICSLIPSCMHSTNICEDLLWARLVLDPENATGKTSVKVYTLSELTFH